MTEDAFFADLFHSLPTPPPPVVVPPGDDCAAIDNGDGTLTLLAVDQIVGGRHYKVDRHRPSPEAIGGKLLARNLSDIAAMGGVPLFCLVSLAMPPERSPAWQARLLRGIADRAALLNVHMIGGDLARTTTDEVGSLTIVGRVEKKRAVLRGGARPGDVLLATGTFGGAVDSGHHLSFSPRLAEGQWLAASGAVTAMIDVSDGLLLDAGRLSAMSGVGLRLDAEAVPRRAPGLTLENVLTDGEDYELLAAVKAGAVDTLLRDWPFAEPALTPVGWFVEEPAGVVDAAGRPFPFAAAGYDHLRG
ncbi:MAG: thiamine-phosphate kinase [Lentisphaeria bacterium]|nr:thiamine-phosphate kinase [Lentisphaeria bacterium]